MAFVYVVSCAFEQRAPMDAFFAWLRDQHIADVCRAGAEDAEIIAVDGALRLDIRYHFASREAFERYEREEAPRLRKEGLEAAARAGVSPNAGITMTRLTGEVVHAAACASGLSPEGSERSGGPDR